jgi:hypothetical protein
VGILIFVAHLLPAAKPEATPAAAPAAVTSAPVSTTSAPVSTPSDPPPEPRPQPAQLDRCAGGKCAPVGTEKGRPLRKQDLGGGVTVQ